MGDVTPFPPKKISHNEMLIMRLRGVPINQCSEEEARQHGVNDYSDNPNETDPSSLSKK